MFTSPCIIVAVFVLISPCNIVFVIIVDAIVIAIVSFVIIAIFIVNVILWDIWCDVLFLVEKEVGERVMFVEGRKDLKEVGDLVIGGANSVSNEV